VRTVLPSFRRLNPRQHRFNLHLRPGHSGTEERLQAIGQLRLGKKPLAGIFGIKSRASIAQPLIH
jgi:hypothetical protein